METGKSVFARAPEKQKVPIKLTQDNIESIIASTHLSENPCSNKTKTEWRIRYLQINGLNYTEISYVKPNEERKYINKFGKVVDYVIDPHYDQYVTKILYASAN